MEIEQGTHILQLIYQFGVLPILLLIIYNLYKDNKILKKDVKKLNDYILEREKEFNREIREIEKENVTLLHKTLSAIKKLIGE